MPRQVGPYRLVSKLAPGGMGRVWRAVDTRDDTPVAVKEPDLEACADSAERSRALRRFDREGRALKRLDHPNVVRVREAFVQDGRPYLVMELVEGETLDRVLARGRLGALAAIGVVRQLLEAAAHAHAHGVVHRDIKPGNVFVLPDGTVKLGDFGIARLLEDTGTRTTTIVATVPYMSPEQALGGAIDGRSDLFSIGIVAYEALAGVHPFRQPDDQPMATVFRIVHERPRPLGLARPALNPGVAACVMRALEKDPARRFASAEDMRDTLLRAMPDREAQHGALLALTRPLPPVAPTRDIEEIRPTRVLPSPAPPPPAAKPAPEPPAAPAPPPAAPRRRRVWPAALVAALAVSLALAFGAYQALQRMLPAPGDTPVVTVPRQTLPAAVPTIAADAAPTDTPSEAARIEATAEPWPVPFPEQQQDGAAIDSSLPTESAPADTGTTAVGGDATSPGSSDSSSTEGTSGSP